MFNVLHNSSKHPMTRAVPACCIITASNRDCEDNSPHNMTKLKYDRYKLDFTCIEHINREWFECLKLFFIIFSEETVSLFGIIRPVDMLPCEELLESSNQL